MQAFSFRFDASKCQECGGRCCTGESGYIFASLNELENIANFLNLAFEDFLLRYVKKVGYRFSLIEKPYENGYACVFFDSQSRCCSIYEMRPKQCRDFPFWDAYLDEEKVEELTLECKGVIKEKK